MNGFDPLYLLFLTGCAIFIGVLICCKISEKFGKDRLFDSKLAGYIAVFGLACIGLSAAIGLMVAASKLMA